MKVAYTNKTEYDRFNLPWSEFDAFGKWADKVTHNEISDSFFYDHEDWILEYEGQCNRWLNKLFDKGRRPNAAAKVIERAYNIYIKK